jgi:formate dehydrogenase major subunit
MDVTRRSFVKLSATAVGATSLTALGFSANDAFAEVRTFKLAHTSETRNTCPYCSVGCGLIMYGLGDRAKNARTEIIHIEGDPDHPVNRGTLCPKGASLLDFVHSPQRLKYPECRPAAEPVADDLATLALDMLVSEQGYGKNGVNLFLHV